MNYRLENLARQLRMLRKHLGRTEAHALVRDAQLNQATRRQAVLDRARFLAENLEAESSAFLRRVKLGIFILRSS